MEFLRAKQPLNGFKYELIDVKNIYCKKLPINVKELYHYISIYINSCVSNPGGVHSSVHQKMLLTWLGWRLMYVGMHWRFFSCSGSMDLSSVMRLAPWMLQTCSPSSGSLAPAARLSSSNVGGWKPDFYTRSCAWQTSTTKTDFSLRCKTCWSIDIWSVWKEFAENTSIFRFFFEKGHFHDLFEHVILTYLLMHLPVYPQSGS